MPKRNLIGIAVFFIMAQSLVAVPMLDQRLNRGGVGVKVGVFNSTTMHIESEQSTLITDEYQWKAGFSGGPFFDFRLGKGHLLSLAIELHDVQMMQDREKLFDMNLGYKATFYNRQNRIAYRPGLAAGFGYISDIGDIDKINVMTSKVFLEMVFLSHPKYSYLLEFAIAMLPTGNSRHYKVHSNPYLMFRFGIVI